MAEKTLSDVVNQLEALRGDQKRTQDWVKERAREDDRKGGEDGEEIAIKVEGAADKAKGLFSKMKLGGLATTFLTGAMSGIGKGFTALGNSFSPALLKALGKIAPWAMILAGLSMAIEDGITGWMKAESWGTSKVSGFLGGFFGGAAKGGIKNAFKNAGKWALIGAGIGTLVVPVVGTIVGGLAGAVIGGILGWIGGEKLAKGFDGLGAWFYKQFETLVLGPIKAVWDFIAPDWAKSVTDNMEWSDLLPPGLTKLFNGEYFTFDMPEFTWTDLFPKFLVDLFNNVTKVAKKQTWSWMDLLPPFLTKFFTGEYAPGKQEFKWQDLVPEFIWKVIEVAKTAWADTPFTWRSLVPNFILKIIDATKPIEGSFSWMDLVPTFISDLVAAGAAEATKTGEFSWKALLPTWMVAAYDSTVGLAQQAKAKYFEWKSLLPEWLQGYLTTAEGAVSSALGEVGSWNWKSLLPKFIQDFFDDPTKLAKEIGDKGFDWKDLLPQFIRDFFTDKKIDKTAETAGLAMDWWKSLLPSWIRNIMDGEMPWADRDEEADVKAAEEAKGKLVESGKGLMEMFDIDKMLAGVDWEAFNFGSILGMDLNMGNKLKGMMKDMLGFKQGGLVQGTGLAMLHGTKKAPEFVLDNEATATFLQAAHIMSGANLANLQRGKSALASGGGPVIIQAPTTQINQNQSAMIPGLPIEPGNVESQLN